jgi:DNA-binding MarR family transcriptional regulator
VLEPHQLTHVQFVLLASLWWLTEHEDHPPTQARLAQQAGTDPMMTSQVTRKLETRGLLERAFDPTDSRARRLRLTAAGRALVARALADVEAADNEFFSALGGDRDTFTQGLQTLGSSVPTDQTT